MAVTSDLPYEVNDANHHFNEPPDCFERYIDPSKRDLVIRDVTAPDGKVVRLFAGKPSKFLSSKDRQVTFAETEIVAMTGTTKEDALRESGSTQEQGAKDLRFVPGILLNRLNPLKGLTEAERAPSSLTSAKSPKPSGIETSASL